MRFFTFVLTLFAFVFYSLYSRIVAPLFDNPLAYVCLLVLGFVLVGSILWWFLIYVQSRGTEIKPYERFLEKLTHVSMAYVSQLILLTVIRDLILIFSTFFPFHSPLIHDPESSYWILGGGFLLLVVGMIQALRAPKINRIQITDSRIKSLRIVQISDLHIGSWIGEKYVEKLIRQIQDLGPIDLFILTGDIGDGDPVEHKMSLEPFKRIEAKLGKFAVTGNHEGYWNEEAWNANLREIGFQILDNESVKIDTRSGPISIHGMSDLKPDPKTTFEKIDPAVFSLFLVHQPKHTQLGIDAGASLQLSGHTHAGQFIPWSLIIGLFHKYPKGFYRLGKTKLYVHAGTGFWGPPTRLGTRSEIALIEVSPTE